MISHGLRKLISSGYAARRANARYRRSRGIAVGSSVISEAAASELPTAPMTEEEESILDGWRMRFLGFSTPLKNLCYGNQGFAEFLALHPELDGPIETLSCRPLCCSTATTTASRMLNHVGSWSRMTEKFSRLLQPCDPAIVARITPPSFDILRSARRAAVFSRRMILSASPRFEVHRCSRRNPMSEAEWTTIQEPEWQLCAARPRSVCACGPFGEGPRSDHAASDGRDGRGPCLAWLRGRRFVWQRWFALGGLDG